MGNLLDLLAGTVNGWNPDVPQQGVRPGYGLSGAQIGQQSSAMESTLAPGQTRSREDLLSMLMGVIEAAGMAVVPGVGPRKMEQRAPARVRPGHEAEFAKWFGESKVVDAKGKPETVYHGTNRQFSSFDPEQAQSKTWNPNAVLGHFFTPDKIEGSRYATGWGQKGGAVIPAHLSIKKPYEMPYKEFNDLAMAEWNYLAKITAATGKEATKADRIKAAEQARQNSLYVRRALQDQGHDGIIIRNTKGEPTEWIAFEPSQIKSATGNRGTYSSSEDIRE